MGMGGSDALKRSAASVCTRGGIPQKPSPSGERTDLGRAAGGVFEEALRGRGRGEVGGVFRLSCQGHTGFSLNRR